MPNWWLLVLPLLAGAVMPLQAGINGQLAKHLSTDDSPGFVNGVLGQVMLVTPQIRAAADAVRGPDDAR